MYANFCLRKGHNENICWHKNLYPQVVVLLKKVKANDPSVVTPNRTPSPKKTEANETESSMVEVIRLQERSVRAGFIKEQVSGH